MTAAPIDEVVDLLRTLRLPHMRAAAPDLLATAKAPSVAPLVTGRLPNRRSLALPTLAGTPVSEKRR